MPHTENTTNACANGHGNGYNENGITVNVEELAVSPNLPDQVPGLLDKIAAFSKQYLGAEPQARLKLLETARSLVYALETPREAIIRHCWAEVRVALIEIQLLLYIYLSGGRAKRYASQPVTPRSKQLLLLTSLPRWEHTSPKPSRSWQKQRAQSQHC
jgi:hypothetical protein